MSGKKEIDIELLLRLTMEEMLKDPNAPAPYGTNYIAVIQQFELQTHMVSDGRPNSGSWPYMDYKLGGPHPDALVVKAAVDALPNRSVALLWPEDRALLAPDFVSIVVGDSEEPEVLPDGHYYLGKLQINAPALIIHHAIQKSRPPWDLKPIAQKMMAQNSRQAAMYGQQYSKDRFKEGSRCPLLYEPTHAEVIEERMEYAAWHAAITQLAASMELQAHKPLPPKAAALPWLTGPEPKPHILRSASEIEQSRLLLTPKRRAPLPPEKVDPKIKRPKLGTEYLNA